MLPMAIKIKRLIQQKMRNGAFVHALRHADLMMAFWAAVSEFSEGGVAKVTLSIHFPANG
jgi:hypothetical protein